MSGRRLVVLLYGRLAGVIERDGGSLTFTYDEAYRSDPVATPLSLSMPLTGSRYTHRWVEAFLRGLLPDNDDVRRRWAEHFGLRDRDTFGLIAAIGSDAAGGALFVPEEAYPSAVGDGTVEPVSDAQIAERLRRLRSDASDWLGEGEHWSLAGAQSKFTLRTTVDGWASAHGAEPSTHIVKPGIGTIPWQALIEHVSMTAAGIMGLQTAETSYVEFEDQPAIVVTRFDRRQREGMWERIHQEDFCQVFALDPSRKYESNHGPGVNRIAAALLANAGHMSVEQFGRAVLVNYLLGAPDAHAKNFSVMLASSAVQLAPLYDVASGLTATRGSRLRFPKIAMSIGGERAFGEVRGLNWNRFARALELPGDLVHDWVWSLAHAAPPAVEQAIDELPISARSHSQLVELAHRVRQLSDLTIQTLGDINPGRGTGPAGAELLAQPPRSDNSGT